MSSLVRYPIPGHQPPQRRSATVIVGGLTPADETPAAPFVEAIPIVLTAGATEFVRRAILSHSPVHAPREPESILPQVDEVEQAFVEAIPSLVVAGTTEFVRRQIPTHQPARPERSPATILAEAEEAQAPETPFEGIPMVLAAGATWFVRRPIPTHNPFIAPQQPKTILPDVIPPAVPETPFEGIPMLTMAGASWFVRRPIPGHMPAERYTVSSFYGGLTPSTPAAAPAASFIRFPPQTSAMGVGGRHGGNRIN